jgi:hypothetical protein
MNTTEATLSQRLSTLSKHHSHLFYFVKDEVLKEVYQTIRGRRYREIMPMPGFPNTDNISEAQVLRFCNIYLGWCNKCGSCFEKTTPHSDENLCKNCGTIPFLSSLIYW